MDDRQHDPAAAAAADRAAEAVRRLDVPAPPHLRGEVVAAVERAQQQPSRRRLRGRPLAAALSAATAAVVLVVVLVVALGGSGGEAPGAAPTVPQAARVALAEPTAGAPAARPGDRLDASIAGIDFPDWSAASWRAAGARTDELDGRELRTVVYDNDRGERIGYAIADGEALPWGGGDVVERNGVPLWVYDVDGATVVAWLRDGHTCILAARGVAPRELMRLASSRNA